MNESIAGERGSWKTAWIWCKSLDWKEPCMVEQICSNSVSGILTSGQILTEHGRNFCSQVLIQNYLSNVIENKDDIKLLINFPPQKMYQDWGSTCPEWRISATVLKTVCSTIDTWSKWKWRHWGTTAECCQKKKEKQRLWLPHSPQLPLSVCLPNYSPTDKSSRCLLLFLRCHPNTQMPGGPNLGGFKMHICGRGGPETVKVVNYC